MPTLLFAASFIVDAHLLSKARPPKQIATLEDFRKWKVGRIMGHGTYERSRMIYTVMLAPTGRCLASGPSGYLFDPQGRFVDWTSDMGDFYTVSNRFSLTGGVKDLKPEKE